MKKQIRCTFLAAGIMAVSSLPVMASDFGTVNFAGKIVADTCVVNVDDSNSTVSTVTFADTYPSDYGTDGKIGTSKDFKIEVSGCDPLVSKLNLKFSGTTTDAAYKRLQNDLTGEGNATHVGITVTNKNGGNGDVLFNGSVPDSATDVINNPDGTTASVFNYTANVIQVGDTLPTAGHYSASATFEVMYR
ncbi:fimbrial protein [Enterobacter hormaechei]|uniref:fimbrial protein n=1 Tax=Enterobacter hormaechei TaxID=158836 RepID=UPI00190E099C|nr:fimbrial protein [Enterobacter hormaechei]MBK4607598.1 type 1 fimbrial protein [Enterobacter hormaechei]MBK4637650.1 type 1 fimbrial protein [Enterobacter hormaechei]MCF2344938.1 type 1 fimbrial protein [Enterobacter hormaechei]MCF2372098.1 type 1 fimbrial protein [Enterobacter hormaechei]